MAFRTDTQTHLHGSGPVRDGTVPGRTQLVLLGRGLVLGVQGDTLAGLHIGRGHQVLQCLGLGERGIR